LTGNLVFRKIVRVEVRDRDRYGRLVGDMFTSGGGSLNAGLVRTGFAWWYRRYAPTDTKLAALEAEARAAKCGLRVDTNAIPPWVFSYSKVGTRNDPRRTRNRKRRSSTSPMDTSRCSPACGARESCVRPANRSGTSRWRAGTLRRSLLDQQGVVAAHLVAPPDRAGVEGCEDRGRQPAEENGKGHHAVHYDTCSALGLYFSFFCLRSARLLAASAVLATSR
jgi:hypothetical protein